MTTVLKPARSQYSMVLVLAPLNGTFERKSLIVPFYPDVLKLGRQTNNKTVPSPDNGYFDSRVLSRQHAELWANKDTGKIWIKDAKSSNGTYINNLRLSTDNTESEPHELKKNDVLELGIDISNDDGSSLVHRKISAKVERISIMSLQTGSSGGGSGTNGSGGGGVLGNQGPRRFDAFRSKADSLDVALFGDVDASLEDLALGHARNSVGGLFMNAGVTNSVSFEMTVKKLVNEIHAAKVESAKIASVSRLLEDISNSQKKSKVLNNRLETRHAMTSASKDNESKSFPDSGQNGVQRHSAPPSSAHLPHQPINKLAEIVTSDSFPDSHTPSLPPPPHEDSSQDEKYEALSRDYETRLQAALSELEQTKCQLELFKGRALAAEGVAMRNSKVIAELNRSLAESKNIRAQHEKSELSDSTAESSVEISATSSSREAISHLSSKAQVSQSSNANDAVRVVSSAIIVVLVGIGVMASLNSIRAKSP